MPSNTTLTASQDISPGSAVNGTDTLSESTTSGSTAFSSASSKSGLHGITPKGYWNLCVLVYLTDWLHEKRKNIPPQILPKISSVLDNFLCSYPPSEEALLNRILVLFALDHPTIGIMDHKLLCFIPKILGWHSTYIEGELIDTFCLALLAFRHHQMLWDCNNTILFMTFFGNLLDPLNGTMTEAAERCRDLSLDMIQDSQDQLISQLANAIHGSSSFSIEGFFFSLATHCFRSNRPNLCNWIRGWYLAASTTLQQDISNECSDFVAKFPDAIQTMKTQIQAANAKK